MLYSPILASTGSSLIHFSHSPILSRKTGLAPSSNSPFSTHRIGWYPSKMKHANHDPMYYHLIIEKTVSDPYVYSLCKYFGS